MNVDLLLVDLVLTSHLIFILWVIFGWIFTRRRPFWRDVHIGCVAYGIFIEVSNLTCPLTWLENRLEVRGGMKAFHQPFILHYLDALVYPNVSLPLLIVCAVAVCAAILAVYARRYARRDANGW